MLLENISTNGEKDRSSDDSFTEVCEKKSCWRGTTLVLIKILLGRFISRIFARSEHHQDQWKGFVGGYSISQVLNMFLIENRFTIHAIIKCLLLKFICLVDVIVHITSLESVWIVDEQQATC
jgi:hypothetical protein